MKHLKIYEDLYNQYKPGDYVLLVDHFVNKDYSLSGKIEDAIFQNKYKIKRYTILETIATKWSTDWYTIYDIERLLTHEEIEIYKMKENITKFNL